MKIYIYLLSFLILLSCQSQIPDKSFLVKKDLELTNIYKKFIENRHDYDENGRDTILNLFKSTLLNTLSNNLSST